MTTTTISRDTVGVLHEPEPPLHRHERRMRMRYAQPQVWGPRVLARVAPLVLTLLVGQLPFILALDEPLRYWLAALAPLLEGAAGQRLRRANARVFGN